MKTVLKAQARGVKGPTEDFETLTIDRRELSPEDVLIDIKFCGICHSDIHFARGEWGKIPYPAVPGHEIVGIVSEVGSEVTKYVPGDRVGVGCMVDSCRECDHCKHDLEQYCEKGHVGTYGGLDKNGQNPMGGSSSRIVVPESFVVRIPDGLDLKIAAPLLCAGITTYSPLRHWNVGPGSKVAVVGLGGLGHVGVQLARALGAEVTVISQTLSKKEDGLRLGADHYYASSDPETFPKLAGQFDIILNTVSAQMELGDYLSTLKVDGTLVNVGAPADPLQVNAFPLLLGRRSLAGSAIGGIKETQEMLDFCAEHGVAPEIELISADQIDGAWERVLKSDVRFRFVIDNGTI